MLSIEQYLVSVDQFTKQKDGLAVAESPWKIEKLDLSSLITVIAFEKTEVPRHGTSVLVLIVYHANRRVGMRSMALNTPKPTKITQDIK